MVHSAARSALQEKLNGKYLALKIYSKLQSTKFTDESLQVKCQINDLISSSDWK